MMNDGLVVSWGAQGKLAAEQMGRWLGVEINWFDGNLDLNQQRANMEKIASQDWDFVAVQPGSIGTLVEATERLTQRGIPRGRYGYTDRAVSPAARDRHPDLHHAG